MFQKTSAYGWVCLRHFLALFSAIFALLFIALATTTSAMALSIERGPYLQQPSSHSIIIRWRTDLDSQGVVRYGDSPTNLSQTESSSHTGTDHVVKINGLSSNTRYYYSVGSNDSQPLAGAETNYFFKTSPSIGSSQATRLWVLGDSGTANDDARRVRDAYLNHISNSKKADLLLMLGDNAYGNGTDDEYQRAVFDTYPTVLRNTPLWSTLGNHDGRSADSDTETGPYYDIFSFPKNAESGGIASGTEAYYSFDHSNIHIVVLDSHDTDRSTNGAMATWLRQDLQNTRQKWLIAFWHHPPYSKGSHNSDAEQRLIEMRTNFLPILEEFGVDLVLSGHSHSYERSKLIDGHYGDSRSLESAMILNNGDGSRLTNGCDGTNSNDTSTAYNKSASKTAHQGTVYITAGSSGKISGGALNHPVMCRNLNNLGSMIIDINDNSLDVVFLRENGSVPDKFTIAKGDIALTVGSATATNATTVDVVFNKAVEKVSAENVANYSIDNATGNRINIDTAILQSDRQTLRLTTTSLTAGQNYTLTVSNIKDTDGNTLTPSTQTASFQLSLVSRWAFQNGLLPNANYKGTTDAYIAEETPNQNYGNTTNLLVDGKDGNSDNDLSSLIRWDISAISQNAMVNNASITVEIFDKTNDTYQIYALKNSWNESEVTWNNVSERDTQVLGTVTGRGSHTIELNAEGLTVVQQWINDPSNNFGIIIANSTENNGVDFYSSEFSTINQRPKLLINLNAAPTSDEEITTLFQNGVFPTTAYTGTKDTYIAEENPNTNYGNAMSLLVDGDDGDGNDLSSLMRWDISAIPQNAVISHASINVDAFNNTNDTYKVYTLKSAWSESDVTWNTVSDRDIQVLGTLSGIGSQTIELNANGLAVVQQWINNPNTNFGIIITDSNASDRIDFHSSEFSTATSRPKLSVTYQ